MVKSPMEYFEEQFLDLSDVDTNGVTEAEQYIVQNYFGQDESLDSEYTTISERSSGEKRNVIQETLVTNDYVVTDKYIQSIPEIQLVSFQLGSQLYSIPTIVVQEVVRKVPIFKLPFSSKAVSGVIKLRGDITPIVQVSSLLNITKNFSGESSMFTLICNYKAFQFGIQIDNIHHMYRTIHEDIQWSVDSLLGVAGEYIIGLFKLYEKLIPILSIERIVAEVFQRKA